MPTPGHGTCREVFEGAHELFVPLNGGEFRTGDAFRSACEDCLAILTARFTDFERLLERDAGPFFLGQTPYFCDFAAFHHIELSHFIDEAILAGFPRLHEFTEAMRALPGIGAYLAERPELIGVGVGPKLVINGVPVPTGVMAD